MNSGNNIKIKGAVFDLDGTLVDSTSIWKDIGARYLKNRGLQPRFDLWNQIMHYDFEQTAAFFQREYGIPAPIETMVQDFAQMAKGAYEQEIRAKPGVKAFLDFLRQKKVQMCIVTANLRGLTQSVLHRCGLCSYFLEIFTSFEAGSPKSKPDIYWQAQSFLKTKPEETVVFDDLLYAIKAAKQAGCRTAGMYDPEAENAADRIRATADWYFHSWEEAKAFFFAKQNFFL